MIAWGRKEQVVAGDTVDAALHGIDQEATPSSETATIWRRAAPRALSPHHRFVIAMRSPDGVFETWRFASRERSGVLFQFYEEQHENRPDPDRQGKEYQRGVPQRTSSRQEIRRQHHGDSSEYSNDKSAFPVHECSTSISRLLTSGAIQSSYYKAGARARSTVFRSTRIWAGYSPGQNRRFVINEAFGRDLYQNESRAEARSSAAERSLDDRRSVASRPDFLA